MPEIVPVTSGLDPKLVDDLLGLLAKFRVAHLTPERWRNLLQFESDGEWPAGYALVDRGRAVGFLGTLHKRRTIAGREERLCNLSSWIVEDSYRASGLALLRKAVQPKNVTITNFTASDQVAAILKQLGFRELDSTSYLFTPLTVFAPSPFRRRDVTLTGDKEIIRNTLGGDELAIFKDHAYEHCGHLLVTTPGKRLYLLYTVRKMKRLIPYAHVHYTSDSPLLAQLIPQIVRHLLGRRRAAAVLVEGRMMEEARARAGWALRKHQRRLYRSTSMQPSEVDHLYTEFPVLGL